MKIGVVQFYPKFKDPKHNFDRVKELCEEAKLAPGKVDILCLPEMALSGYMFNEQSISEYLEDPNTGITFILCSYLAKRYQCYVFAGYPEKLDRTVEVAEEHQIGANSVHVVNPDGRSLLNYRKTNLFWVDKFWAKPGTGFGILNLPAPLNIRVALGVCMDLNVQPPVVWTSEDGPYELAAFAREKEADLLIILNAWLASDQEAVEEEEPDEPDSRNVYFWYSRLRPLWYVEEEEIDTRRKSTTVVICNRCGREEGTLFGGTSTAFRTLSPAGGVALFGRLARSEEKLAIWEV